MSVGLDGLGLDFDGPNDGGDIAKRAGFSTSAVTEGALARLREDLGAKKRRDREESLSATEVAAAAAIRRATRDEDGEHDLHAVEQGATTATHESDEAEGGHSTGSDGSSSTAGTAVSPVTDMGDQAHVGGTGVVSAASADNLDADDASDDEQAREAQALREREAQIEAEREAARREAEAQRERERAESETEDDVEPPTAEPISVPQRIRVAHGEPNTQAVYRPKLGFRFGDEQTVQVRKFPTELVSRLRSDLAMTTNAEFAQQMDLPGMLAAFVAVQLGMASDPTVIESVDDNTRIAMRAFAQLDRRTAALEDTLATVSDQVGSTDMRVHALSGTVTKINEMLRVLENATTYLVSERIDPTSTVGVLPSEVPVTGGKYAAMRTRLRHETGVEIQDEKLRRGRLIP